jgi:Cu+-exporting ATPase
MAFHWLGSAPDQQYAALVHHHRAHAHQRRRWKLSAHDPPITVPFYDKALAGLSRNLAILSETLDRSHPAHLLPRGIIEDKREKRMAEFTLQIDNMHCGGCVRRVSQALASVEGVVVNDVRVGAARLTSKLDPPPVDLAIAALVKAGYGAHLEQ